MSKRTAVYVRVSTDDQRDNGYSIDSQIRMIKEYCEKNEYLIVDIYNGAGHSGKDLMRPQMQRLLKDIKSKKIDKFVAIKGDRLTRNNYDGFWLLNYCEQNDVKIELILEPYDVGTANGEMILGMNLVFGQRERKEIGARTKRATEEIALEKVHPSKAPYGDTRNKETGKKYNNNKSNYSKLRQISDSICEEYRLNILKENDKYKNSYNNMIINNEYKIQSQSRDTKEYYNILKDDIDFAIINSVIPKQFLNKLKELGYNYCIKTTRLIVWKYGYDKVRIDKTFGSSYSIENIKIKILNSKTQTYVPVPMNIIYNNYLQITKNNKKRYFRVIPILLLFIK